jgi:hypothetical protein
MTTGSAVVSQRKIGSIHDGREKVFTCQMHITEACGKWRMLPPDMPDDEVANLPDKWFCKDNVHDPDRSFCEAEEQNGLWYAYHWENCMKESQGLTPYVAPTSNDHSFDKFAKRDGVLETLLERCERSLGDSSKTTINSWISKYSFSKETIKDAEAEEATKVSSQSEKTSPKKKNQTKLSPRKASPKKPTDGSTTKVNNNEKEVEGSISGGQIAITLVSSDEEQKENQSKQSPAAVGSAKKPNVKEEQNVSAKRVIDEEGAAAGEKRKSPQQSSRRTKSCKPNTPVKTPSKEPETIDLLDSDED